MRPQKIQSSQVAAPDSPHTDFKGPRGRLHHRCGLCHKQGSKLSKCAGCQTVRYCCRHHQVEHRSEHKSICNKIKKCRTRVAKEEHDIRNATPDWITPANAFETGVGRFWGIPNTRPYMRARFDLADTVRRLGTLDGVTEALEHLRDMIRLSRSDNLGMRDLIPPVMLQLDQDQECYDFIKWWETEGRRDDYDWGDPDLPFLNVKNANVLEDVQYMNRKWGHVPYISVVMLLKLKLLVDIININVTRAVLAGRLPPELWKRAELQIVRSPISLQWAGRSVEELTTTQQKLQLHVKLLARAARNLNEHFVSLILNADDHLHERPGYYSEGSFEQMLLVLQYTYPAWWQHEGALELLRSAKSIARKHSEDEIADMMSSVTFKSNPGSDRSKEELLDDVCRNRLWGYFDDAVEDAMSLNADRPSDVKREELRARLAEDMEDEDNLDSDDESE